jgi:peptidyl-prolyl cis-trans isomerase C
MKIQHLVRGVAVAVALTPLIVQAQNLAIVNGKPVPKARVEALLQQAQRAGQNVGPELEAQARDQVVLREIFVQEAEKRGIAKSPAYRDQMELARQSILIRELFDAHRAANPVTDAAAQAEYDKFKAAASGQEYRARHILVETEDEATKLIAQIKAGGKFEDLAQKHSKDPGSGANGGDLDFAKPDNYVPEFSKAMVALKKGDDGDPGQEPVRFPHHQAGRHPRGRLPGLRRRQGPAQAAAGAAADAAVPGGTAGQGEDRLQVLAVS